MKDLSSIYIKDINKKYIAFIIIFVIYRVKIRTGIWPFAPVFSEQIYNWPTLRVLLAQYIDWRFFTKVMRVLYIMLSCNIIYILFKNTFIKELSQNEK